MGLEAKKGFQSPEMATPADPSAGERLLYAKTAGWYEKDAAGVERLLNHAIEAYSFFAMGALTVRTGTSRIYLEGNYIFETCRASVNTAPTGAAVIVDVNKNGSTIYSTQGARPQIAISTNSATGNSPAITTFVLGDYITVDIDQVGSSVAGSDLTVTIRLRKTS
jgi:hypothetical protein